MGKGECPTGGRSSREALNVARCMGQEAFSSRRDDYGESLKITTNMFKNRFS